MVEIIPAIMPTSFADLEGKLESVVGLTSLVQIDIMDGRLTAKKTWPYSTTEQDKDFLAILREEEGFPFWNDIDFEVDLMVREPEKIWRDWVAVGAKRIIFHLESMSDPKIFLETLRKNSVSKDSPLYTEIGIAINVSTANEDLYPFMDQIDFVQFMGISEIGFQGTAFNEDVFAKIEDLRNKYPEHIISIDGGVNLSVAPKLAEVGVNRLVIGSAIFGQENVESALTEFQSLFS
jgi:ribulose-phosphate 3-epimerase